MRVEQAVHERSFLCKSPGVIIAKDLANVDVYQGSGHFVNVSVTWKHVPIYYRIFIDYRFIFGQSLAKAFAKDGLHLKAMPKLWVCKGFSAGGECCTAVWEGKCQNWPMKVSSEQGPKYDAKHRI